MSEDKRINAEMEKGVREYVPYAIVILFYRVKIWNIVHKHQIKPCTYAFGVKKMNAQHNPWQYLC